MPAPPDPPDETWLIRGIPLGGLKDDRFSSGFWNFDDGISIWLINPDTVKFILNREPPPLHMQAINAGQCRALGAVISPEPADETDAPDGHHLIDLASLSKSQRKKVGEGLRNLAVKASVPVTEGVGPEEFVQRLLAAIDNPKN